MRPGVRLAVDVGSVRVGLAACDPSGLIASPVRTLVRDTAGDADVAAVAREAAERGAVEVLVGLPLSLDGTQGPAALRAREYARKIVASVPDVALRFVDERLSTVDAHRALHAAGRTERQFRAVVDQAAAVVLLQQALDVERAGGRPPGWTPDELDARDAGSRPRKPRHRRRTPADDRPADDRPADDDATEGRAP